MPNINEVVGQTPILVNWDTGLSDHIITLNDRRQVLNLITDLTVNNLAVGALKESVLIGTSIACQRVNQADVGTFRCLDRTDPAIVRWMNIPDVKPGSLTCESARAERRYAAFVGYL